MRNHARQYYKSSLIACIILTIIVIGFAGCGSSSSSNKKDNNSPSEPQVESTPKGETTGDMIIKTIGTAGGSLTSVDGHLAIKVPEGALAADTQISIQPISNTAPNGIGTAYRLGPEGHNFAQPIEISFQYDDTELENSSPVALVAAYQDEKGFWKAVMNVTVDPVAKRLTVSTRHFSDWTYLEKFSLTPRDAVVKPGESIQLSVRACIPDDDDLLSPLVPSDDDLLAPLVPTDDDLLAPLVPCHTWKSYSLIQNPAIEGIVGGSLEVGTVSQNQAVLTYTAPSQEPTPNPVAVSVEIFPLEKWKVILVSHITIRNILGRWSGTIGFESINEYTGPSAFKKVHSVSTYELRPIYEFQSFEQDVEALVTVSVKEDEHYAEPEFDICIEVDNNLKCVIVATCLPIITDITVEANGSSTAIVNISLKDEDETYVIISRPKADSPGIPWIKTKHTYGQDLGYRDDGHPYCKSIDITETENGQIVPYSFEYDKITYKLFDNNIPMSLSGSDSVSYDNACGDVFYNCLNTDKYDWDLTWTSSNEEE